MREALCIVTILYDAQRQVPYVCDFTRSKRLMFYLEKFQVRGVRQIVGRVRENGFLRFQAPLTACGPQNPPDRRLSCRQRVGVSPVSWTGKLRL
jgi:hypothetical protein